MSDTEVEVPDLEGTTHVVVDQDKGGADVPAKVDDRPGEDDSTSVRKRIDKLTWRARAAQEALGAERQVRERLEAELSDERQRSQQATQTGHDFAKASFEGQIKQARDALRRAVSDGDADAQAEAMEALADAKAQQAILRPLSVPEQPQRQQTQPQRPQVSPQAVAWLNDNPWFREDRVKQARALVVHDELIAEGFDANSRGYYAALTERTRELADDDETPPPRRAVPAGSGVSRTAAPGARAAPTKVRLSAEQVDAAQALGMTVEAYATEVVRLDRAGRFNQQRGR